MMNVNLLSPDQKKEVRQLRTFHIVKNVTYNLISLGVAVTVALLFSLQIINNDDAQLKEQLTQEAQLQQLGLVTSLQEATQQLNQQIAAVQEIQAKYVSWTGVIANISEHIPNGITIAEATFNDTTMTFSMSGIAETRNDLLNFQDDMETYPIFAGVKFPTTNLTIRENIPFELTGSLTPVIYE